MEETNVTISEATYRRLVSTELQIGMIVNAYHEYKYDGDFKKFCEIILGIQKKEAKKDV